MSIIKALQDYLTAFPGLEMRPLNEVLTDMPGYIPSTYALAPTGNSMIREDVLGNKTYQNNYVFYACEAAADEADRADTYDFLDTFCEWLEERNDEENLPKLPGRYVVEAVNVSNAMLFDVAEDGTGLYQVQIQLIFHKE